MHILNTRDPPPLHPALLRTDCELACLACAFTVPLLVIPLRNTTTSTTSTSTSTSTSSTDYARMGVTVLLLLLTPVCAVSFAVGFPLALVGAMVGGVVGLPVCDRGRGIVGWGRPPLSRPLHMAMGCALSPAVLCAILTSSGSRLPHLLTGPIFASKPYYIGPFLTPIPPLPLSSSP